MLSPLIHRLRSVVATFLFATCCALNVLTKGLIGIVFPIAIVLVYLLLTRGPRGATRRPGASPDV